jgi:hypothetical protein
VGLPPLAGIGVSRAISFALAVLMLGSSPVRLAGHGWPPQGGATHVVIVTGLSVEPRFARMFATAAGTIDDAARTQWHVADSNIVYLSEDPAADAKRMTGKATMPTIGDAFATLARRIRAGDVVLVFLLGHGSGEMETSAVNIPGPDPTAAEYARWLAPLDRATVVFVNASTGSGDFAKVLAGPNRVIVTATKTGMEKNESIFAGYFAAGLAGTDADADKDGRVSVLEAFNYARTQVVKAYESSNRMLTEHAVLADSSGIAGRIAFGGDAASDDPRAIALLGERRVLEASVDSLRRIKTTMDSTGYTRELERLLLQLAAKTQEINALHTGRKP